MIDVVSEKVLFGSTRRARLFQALKVAGWVIIILLFLLVAALIFACFSPDYNMYLVKGLSMEPTINAGDMVITGPAGGLLSGKIEPGTIVTYRNGNSPVTHRVVAVEGDNLITKGDAVEDPDSRPVPISELSGVYLLRIPYVGYLSNFMRTTIGWLVVVVVPTVLIVGLIIRKIIIDVTRKADSDSQAHGEVEHA